MKIDISPAAVILNSALTPVARIAAEPAISVREPIRSGIRDIIQMASGVRSGILQSPVPPGLQQNASEGDRSHPWWLTLHQLPDHRYIASPMASRLDVPIQRS